MTDDRTAPATTAVVGDPSGGLIHDLVLAYAVAAPDAIAVAGPGATLTYADLVHRAGALAARLRADGVGPEVLVGVRLPKTPELPVALLAVLMAGGAYVPLDPAAPPGRTDGVPLRLLLTESDVPPSGNSGNGSQTPAWTKGPAPSPDNLAYVIYTSGSTGRPKGVAVTHRALVASTLAREDWYEPPRAFLFLPAVAFDSAVAAVFGTLARGGALHLPPPGTETDGPALARLVAERRIDSLLALPSLYELLLDSAAPGQLDSLRSVTVAGERCSPRLPARSRREVPGARFTNEYGPAEMTVWSTAWRAPEDRALDLDSVPIGRPIRGVRADVLDPAGQPVPVGTPGELYLAGPTMARGYHERPELTEAVFQPDPSGPPGARRYRTGDLVRLRPDGELEFLGRVDRQVKIRGHRVEPGEVEEVLRRHPGVRSAAVVAKDAAGGVSLAGFVTGPTADPAELHEYLRRTLPEYLVPATLRRLESLPTTVNGKVDMNALAALPADDPGEPPRTDLERVVAEVWCATFGVAEIGREQEIYEFGGSLAVARIALHLSGVFDVEVPLLWVYESATVAGLARWLAEHAPYAAETARRRLGVREGGS
jgi:amino acid adenylation domain-containing protein